jgi:L-lysine exporter family protein LysE/ArgO
MAFLYGLGTGMVLSLTLGTIFFILIQNSIDNGYKGGIVIALGVITSDAVLITLSVFGTSLFPPIKHAETYVSLAGGLLLLLMGLNSLFKKKPRISYPRTKLGNLVYFFSTGFVLNLLNPANFFSWVAIIAYLNASLKYSGGQILVFFIACLLAIFLTEVAISVFADRLKRYFTPQVVLYINRISGSVFLFFGLRLLWSVVSTVGVIWSE